MNGYFTVSFMEGGLLDKITFTHFKPTFSENKDNHSDLTNDILCYPKGDGVLRTPFTTIFKHFSSCKIFFSINIIVQHSKL